MAKQKKRKYGQRDALSLFSFARQFTLAPITNSDERGDGRGMPPAGSAPEWERGSIDTTKHLIEPAWDGHRVLATRVGADVRLGALDFREWSVTFPMIVRALGKLAPQRLAIDGIVCVLDERGAPSFEQLRVAVTKTSAVGSAVLICWDLLWDGDEDLRGVPLVERRRRLGEILRDAPANLMHSDALTGTLPRIVKAAAELGLRGVVGRALEGDHAAPWRAYSTTGAPIDWRRSLSPPPPLSNADKVLYPRDAICKRDIVGYYRDVAPTLLPYLIDRPVVIQRWPDGIDEFDWYQHRVPPRAPDYIRAAWVDGVRRMVIENGDALLYMVNQAGLTYHGFGSRLAALTEPDWAILDLDPGDRATWWDDLLEVALAVRRTLELLELPSVVKTSGQRGLHVLVPLAPGHTFDQAEQLGRGIANLLIRLMPDKVTVENEKDRRGGRLLLDHKQFMAKTLVIPYSLRAADGATVSTPITWDEVGRSLDPRAFTLRTVRARLDARGDLAASLVTGGAQLAPALAKL